jgi:raffinose/stachyose/melibiose transport system permease protein
MRQSLSFRIYARAAALFFVLVTLAPLVFLLFTSFRSMPDIVTNGPLRLPEEWVFNNYPRAWELGNFAVYYRNSIIAAVVTVAAVLMLVLLGSYVFSFLNFHGKGFLFSLLLLGLLIPFQQIMIPLFHTLRGLRMINTLWAIILPQIAMQIPFGVILMRGFMRELPVAILESARLDGANEMQTLFLIVTPLVRPSLMALLIFTAMASWNNFFLPTIMVQRDELRTVPVGLNYFKDQHFTDFPMMAAAAMIIAIPIIIVYLVFQKQMIQGMTLGSVKG